MASNIQEVLQRPQNLELNRFRCIIKLRIFIGNKSLFIILMDRIKPCNYELIHVQIYLLFFICYLKDTFGKLYIGLH